MYECINYIKTCMLIIVTNFRIKWTTEEKRRKEKVDCQRGFISIGSFYYLNI